MTHPAGPLAALAALGRMAQAGQLGVVLSTPDGITDANAAFLRMTGFTRQELSEGQAHWRAITAPEWTSLDDDAVAELSTTGGYGPHRKEYRRRDGARLTVEVTGVLLGDDPMTWVTFVRDLTDAQVGALTPPDSAERLAALAADLARAVTVGEVARTLTDHLRRSSGATAATITEVVPGGHVMRSLLPDGVPAPIARQYAEFPITLDAPSTRAWRGRELIFHPDRASLEAEYPHLARVVVASGVSAALAAPLITGDEVIGVLAAYWATPRTLDPTERAFTTTIAGYAAQALARARLFEAEQAARGRMQALQAVTAGLATAVTSEQIAEVLVDAGMALVATYGVVAMLDRDGDHLSTRTTRNFPADISRSFARIPLGEADQTPIGWTVRSGQPLVLTSAQQIADRFPHAAFTHAATGSASVLCVPVRAAGRVIGALAFGFPSEGRPGDEIVTIAGTLAELAGQALERARLYEAEHAAAQQLQQALLPRVPAELPGVRIGTCYRPAEQGHEVGGDWYDVFELPGGKIGCAAGDVVGHDLAAAAAMGRLQLLLRYTARGGAGPAAVLAALDQASPALTGTDFATVAYAEYDPAAGTLAYACAGHPPPLLLAAGTPAEYLEDGRSGVLGFGGARSEAVVKARPGDRLVLYTDGLIERRDEPIGDGFDRLARAAGELPDEDEGSWCRSLLTALTGGKALADDVAVACIRFSGTG
jgi:PAS domain S-box-containing protein